MGDVISPILLLVLVCRFESMYLKGTGLKFCTQVGSNDPMCSYLSKCL